MGTDVFLSLDDFGGSGVAHDRPIPRSDPRRRGTEKLSALNRDHNNARTARARLLNQFIVAPCHRPAQQAQLDGARSPSNGRRNCANRALSLNKFWTTPGGPMTLPSPRCKPPALRKSLRAGKSLSNPLRSLPPGSGCLRSCCTVHMPKQIRFWLGEFWPKIQQISGDNRN